MPAGPDAQHMLDPSSMSVVMSMSLPLSLSLSSGHLKLIMTRQCHLSESMWPATWSDQVICGEVNTRPTTAQSCSNQNCTWVHHWICDSMSYQLTRNTRLIVLSLHVSLTCGCQSPRTSRIAELQAPPAVSEASEHVTRYQRRDQKLGIPVYHRARRISPLASHFFQIRQNLFSHRQLQD